MGDKRVEKTLALIENSFLSLSEEKDIDKITIKEMCERANINRSTFYDHYTDYQDFLNKMEISIARMYLDISEQYHYDMDTSSMVECLLDCISKNPGLFSLMFQKNRERTGWNLIYKTLEERTIPVWLEESDVTLEQAKLLLGYILSGTHSMLEDWYNNEFAMDKQELKELIDNVVKYGLYNYIYTK